jgi:hypothetical protein
MPKLFRRLIKAALARQGYEIGRLRPPPREVADHSAFMNEEFAIWERHRAQTRETVAALNRRYEQAVLGSVPVWTLLERLAECVDPTDRQLGCTSQQVHTLQVLEAMEADGVTDRDLLLAALVHDIGKVLLLTGEAPENVVCLNEPIGQHEPGIGLDRCLLQWNHDEFAYLRLREHAPEHVVWLIRYHSIVLPSCEPLMNARDRDWTERYLRPFHKYDQGSKSTHRIPRKRLTDYRDLAEATLPRTILF